MQQIKNANYNYSIIEEYKYQIAVVNVNVQKKYFNQLSLKFQQIEHIFILMGSYRIILRFLSGCTFLMLTILNFNYYYLLLAYLDSIGANILNIDLLFVLKHMDEVQSLFRHEEEALQKLYVQNVYQLHLKEVHFPSSIKVTTVSSNSYRIQQIKTQETITLNQIVEVSVIKAMDSQITMKKSQMNMKKPSVQNSNNQIILTLYKINDQHIKQVIGICKFDTQQIKIIKEEKNKMFKINLLDREGYLEYRFISAKSKNIRQSDFNTEQKIKITELNQQYQLEKDQQYAQLMNLVEQKNTLISNLEAKYQALIHQFQQKRHNRSFSLSPSPDLLNKSGMSSRSIQKNLINFNVKMTPSQTNIAAVNKALKKQNQNMRTIFQRIKEDNTVIKNQNQKLKQQVQSLKKQFQEVFNLQLVQSQGGKNSQIQLRIQQPHQFRHHHFKHHQSQKSKQSQTSKVTSKRKKSFSDSNSELSVNSHQKRVGFESMKLPEVHDHQTDQILQDSRQHQISRNEDLKQSVIQLTVPNNQQNDLKISGIAPTSQKDIIYVNQLISNKKIQEKAAIIIKNLERQKQILIRKLSIKQEQIKKLFQDLSKAQNSMDTIKVDFDQQRNLSKSQHIERLQQIKNQRITTIKQMQKNSKNSPQFQHLLYRQKVQAQVQRLRFQLSDLRIRNRQLQVFKKVHQDRNNAENMKLKIINQTLSKQKQFLQQKIAEISEQNRNYSQSNLKYKQMQQQYQQLKIEFGSTSNQLNQCKQKYQNCQKLRIQNQKSLQKYKKMVFERDDEWSKLKKIQLQHQKLQKKVYNLERSNQNYNKSYQQIKKFVIRLQSAFYQHKRSKGNKAQQQTEKQLNQKLKNIKQKLIQSQSLYVKQQIQNFKAAKKIEEEHCDKKLQLENKKIVESSAILQDKKQGTLKKVQQQNQAQRQKKIKQLNQKIAKLQNRPNFQTIQYESFPLADKVKFLQDKIKEFTQKQNQMIQSSADLKIAIKVLKVQNQNKQSTIQQMKNSSSLGYIPPTNNLGPKQSMFNSKYIQDQMQKSRTFMNQHIQRNKKTYEEQMFNLRNKNGELMQQKKRIQLQLQAQKFNIRKLQQKTDQQARSLASTHQRQIQSQKKQNVILKRQFQKASQQLQQLRNQNPDLKQAVRTLSNQLSNVSKILQDEIQKYLDLQRIIQQKDHRIQQYEKAQKQILHQVQSIKKQSQAVEKQFRYLFEQRNEEFLKIQKVKDAEIQKLIQVISQLQRRLQNQVKQLLIVQGQSDSQLQKIKQLQQQLTEYQQINQVTQQKLQKERADNQIIQTQLQRQNVQLQTNIIQIAQQIQSVEMQLHQKNLKLESIQKQNQALKKLQIQIKTQQNVWIKQKKSLEDFLYDQTEQLKQFEQKYIKLQREVTFTSEQSQKIKLQSMNYYEERSKLVQDLHKKQNQILKLQLQLTKKGNVIQSKQNQIRQTIQSYQNQLKIRVSQFQQMKIRVSKVEQPKKQDNQNKGNFKLFVDKKQSNNSIKSERSSSNKKSSPKIKPKQSLQKCESQSVHSQNNNSFLGDQIGIKNKKSSRESLIKIQSQSSDPLQNKSLHIINVQSHQDISIDSNHNYDEDQIYNQEESQMIEHSPRELIQKIHELKNQKHQLQLYIEDMKKVIEEQHTSLQSRGLLREDSLQTNFKSVEEGSPYKNDVKCRLDTKQEETVSEKYSKQSQRSNKSRRKKLLKLNRSINDINLSDEEPSSNKIQQLELILHQSQSQCQQLKRAVQQQKNNTEKLIQEIKTYAQDNQNLNNIISQKQSQVQQVIQQFQNQKKLFQQKLEQIVSQVLQKDTQLANALNQLEKTKQEIDILRGQIEELQSKQNDHESLTVDHESRIQALKCDFRKYQEEAELQILTLRQKIDDFAQQIKQKYRELELLGEKYLNLSQQNAILKDQITSQQQLLDAKDFKCQNLVNQIQQFKKQYNRIDDHRMALLQKLRQMQEEKVGLQEQITTITKASSLSLKKHKIQVQTLFQQIKNVKLRIQQKDEHLISMKGQIGLYNDQCSQLKRTNQTLNIQLFKVQKSLKQIMNSYQGQFDNLTKKMNDSESKIKNLQNQLLQKQKELTLLIRQLRQNQNQILAQKRKSQQTLKIYQKFKSTKNIQLQQEFVKYSYKNDQCQKLRYQYEKQQEQWFNRQAQYIAEKDKLSTMLKNSKDKLVTYEETLNELQKQISEVSQRPTAESFQQISFENQLFKNRIKQLQQLLASSSQVSNVSSDNAHKQIRRYKIQKEHQISDLENQLQNYSNQINKLEENNFHLKKQIENIRHQLLNYVQQNQQLKDELQDKQEQIQDLNKEMEFYQTRRYEDLNKLLNQTDG